MDNIEINNVISGRRMAVGYAAGIAGGLCWAIGGNCGEGFFRLYDLSSDWLIPFRLLFAGLILLTSAKLSGSKLLPIWKDRKAYFPMFLFALLGLAICQYGFYTAIQYSTAATATVLSYITPVFVLAWNAFRQKRKPHFYELLAIVLVVAGTVVCATHGDLSTMVIDPRALFWGLACALGFAFYTLVPAGLIPRYGLFTVIGWGMICASAMLFPICRPWKYGVVHIDFRMVCLFTGVVLFGTILSFSLYQFGCGIIGGFAGSIISSVEPIASIAISVFLLHNRFLAMDFLGFFLIMSTIPVIAVGDLQVRRKIIKGDKANG